MWHFYGKHTLSHLLSPFLYLLFLKSISNWPLCPVHLAWSFNLEAHRVSLKPYHVGDFGTRMKETRCSKFQFFPRFKPGWCAVGNQPMWTHCLQSPNSIAEQSYLKWHVLWLLCFDLWGKKNVSGPSLKIRSLLSLMNSRFRLMWPSRQF